MRFATSVRDRRRSTISGSPLFVALPVAEDDADGTFVQFGPSAVGFGAVSNVGQRFEPVTIPGGAGG